MRSKIRMSKQTVTDLDGNPVEIEVVSWQLAVMLSEEDIEHGPLFVGILEVLSKRKVSIGTRGFFLYGYFEEEGMAKKADRVLTELFAKGSILDIVEGSFNVTRP